MIDRVLFAAAALAVSLATQAQRIDREVNAPPPNPQLVLTDGRGDDRLQLAFDGVRLFGRSTLSFSPYTAHGMELHVGSQVGWVVVRVGDQHYAMPLFPILNAERSR